LFFTAGEVALKGWHGFWFCGMPPSLLCDYTSIQEVKGKGLNEIIIG
jgi:hypothetical protein